MHRLYIGIGVLNMSYVQNPVVIGHVIKKVKCIYYSTIYNVLVLITFHFDYFSVLN